MEINPYIIVELFDLKQKVSEEIVDQFTDAIESAGVRVDTVKNLDAKLYFSFSYPTLGSLTDTLDVQVSGNFIVDRVRGNFAVQMDLVFNESIANPIKYVPLVTSDFNEATRYIELVNVNMDNLVYQMLPNRSYRAIFNEAVAYDAASGYRQLSLNAKTFLISLLEKYNDGHGQYTFNISNIDDNIIKELVNGGYIMVRGNHCSLDRTAIDSLRSITFG